jgi:hypothetical protein
MPALESEDGEPEMPALESEDEEPEMPALESETEESDIEERTSDTLEIQPTLEIGRTTLVDRTGERLNLLGLFFANPSEISMHTDNFSPFWSRHNPIRVLQIDLFTDGFSPFRSRHYHLSPQ